MKKLFLPIFVLAILVLLGGCAVNKKKKCNTCPKWTSEVNVEFLRNVS